MPDLNPEHVKKVIRAINQGPFFVHMSIKVTEMGIGHSTVQSTLGGNTRTLSAGSTAASMLLQLIRRPIGRATVKFHRKAA